MSKIKTDTSLWLHNKLGNVNDLWSSGSICSQLSNEVLRNIRDCFTDLQPLVKVKLLIAFLHIPRRNVDEWKNELRDIIEIASVDSDQWVSMVGELLKVYPHTGTINFDITENSDVFNELIVDLKKLIKKHSDQGILPIECLYLNKNALNSIIGSIPTQNKHFTLKRKPKSAALRAELLQKSTDAATNVKKGVLGGSIPIRHRSGSKDLSDSTPLKGIPSRMYINPSMRSPIATSAKVQIGAGRNPTRPSMPGVRRDGGIKLLDIAEQPLGPDAKRKKKTQDQPETPNKNNKELEKTPSTADQTPDYAAGLMSLIPPSPAPVYIAPSMMSGPPSVSSTPLATGLSSHSLTANQSINQKMDT